MNHKIFIIIGALVILVLGTMTVLTITQQPKPSAQQNLESASLGQENILTDANLKPAPTPTDNPVLAEVVEIEKIDLNKELSEWDVDFFEAVPSIPKSVAEVELMTIEEKIGMGLDPELVVQVLDRFPDGRIKMYNFITDASGVTIDTR